MFIAFIIYLLLLLGIGIYDAFRVKNFNDFVVAGKRQNTFTVFMSLMATMIGASATVGLMSTVMDIGFSAFWWLGVGTVGLVLQSVFLSERVRSLEACTLPEVAKITVGRGAEVILAVLIAVSWTGIIAAQFIAMTQLISLVTGRANTATLLVLVSAAVILYTTVGGQLSVVKTDVIQSVIIFIGIIACFLFLFAKGGKDTEAVYQNISLFQENYTVKNLIYQLFVVGGTYLLGPDIISRNLLSKDGKTAKRAAGIASGVLVLFAGIIVLIGMWVKYNVPQDVLAGQNPLVYLINSVIPKPVGILLAIGLISALLSSADTCLINAASIIERDILKRDKVLEIRIWVLVLGVISTLIAIGKSDIIATLTGAYSVYAPGVVFPLLIAILCHKKKEIRKPVWIAAVVCGGLCGAVTTYTSFGFYELPLIGMGISLVISLLSVKWQKEKM